ncbi:MAG: hypothetical protein LQ346_005714 [Caloplaca aetnensis]|nr:MAG: hypothetical protein LQ346_005714 [Caloplaca aetnensis]
MSDQIQIFWDPYLKAFVIEVPTRNRSPSAPPPIVVTPDDFQAPPTQTASFSMNSNAPLGSFFNPIPHPSDPATMAASPVSMQIPTQAAQAPAQFLWPQTATAPLGSFQNPVPYEICTPTGSAASPPTAVPSTASAATPGYAAQPQDWQPTTADSKVSSCPPAQNSSPPTGTIQQLLPNAAAASSPDPGMSLSSESSAIIDSLQPTTHEGRSTRRPNRSRSNSGRRVYFNDEAARIRASRDAEAEASARARDNEAEVIEFTDVEAANRVRSRRGMTRTAVPSTTSSFLAQPSSMPLQPESRSSSSGSFIDSGREWGYERWPLCTVCDDRPAMIKKSGIGFCDACFGQACAAEEARKRGSQRR